MKVFAAAGLKPRPLSVNSSEDETHPIYECIAALRVVLSKVENLKKTVQSVKDKDKDKGKDKD